MATNQIDGGEVTRYQGRIAGVFDLDDETQYFQMGDVVMAVVVLHAKHLDFDDNAKGDRIGTYRFGVRDFALVSDDILRKSLFHHLPHLEPPDQLPFPVDPALTAWHDGHAVEQIINTASTTDAEEYHELEDTVITVEQIPDDDILVADADDGEVFSPTAESRERGRLSQGQDPVLQRFLRGELDVPL